MGTAFNHNQREEDRQALLSQGFDPADVETVLSENAHKYSSLAFERRMVDADAPFISNSDGTRSTHKMASGFIKRDGSQVHIAFPTIVPDTETQSGLRQFKTSEEAARYAVDTKEFRKFSTKFEAQNYARGGYKEGGGQVPTSEFEAVNKALSEDSFASYIAGNESFTDHIYPDGNTADPNLESFGYGHQITSQVERDFIQNTLDTIDQLPDEAARQVAKERLALQIFEKDMPKYVDRAEKLFKDSKIPIDQWTSTQQMAVIDMVYRGALGSQNTPKLHDFIMNDDWENASKEVLESREIKENFAKHKGAEGSIAYRDWRNSELMIHNNVAPTNTVPESGKGKAAKKGRGFIEAITGDPLEFTADIMDLATRAHHRAVVAFADSFTPGVIGKIEGAVPDARLSDTNLTRIMAGEKPQDIKTGKQREEAYLNELNKLKETYETELAENPAETTTEQFAEAAGGVVAVLPDFVAMGHIMAPLKGLAGVKYLNKFPRLAKFFAETQHAAATFAGVESKRGPEAAMDGYLAGVAFHIAGLPQNKMAKSLSLSITGALTAKLQGADETQVKANGILFLLMGMVGAGKGRRKNLKPKEYKAAKAEVLKIAEDAGVPKKNTLVVIEELEILAEGNITEGLADVSRRTFTDSRTRRVMDIAYEEVVLKGKVDTTRPTQAVVDILEGRQAPETPAGSRGGEPTSKTAARTSVEVAEGKERPLRTAGEIADSPDFKRVEREARVKELFKPEEHPNAPKKPKSPLEAEAEPPERIATKDPKNADRLKKFRRQIADNDLRAAQENLARVQEEALQRPEDAGLQALREVMETDVRRSTVGRAVPDRTNVHLYNENKNAFLRTRRRLGALTKKLGWNDLRYRAFLKEEFGVESSRTLTATELDMAVLKLRERAGETVAKPKTDENIISTEPRVKKSSSTVRPENGKVGKTEIITLEQEQNINTRLGKLKKLGMTDSDQTYVLEQAGLKPDHDIGFQNTKSFTTKKQAKALSKQLHLYEDTLAHVRKKQAAVQKDPRVEYREAYSRVSKNVAESGSTQPLNRAGSVRYYMGRLEELSGGRLPFQQVYSRIIQGRNFAVYNVKAEFARLENVLGENGRKKFARLLASDKTSKRITDYIASKSRKKNAPKEPKDITSSEKLIADEMVKILDEYKWKYRSWRFFEWQFQNKKFTESEWGRWGKELEAADRAYEQGGIESLSTVLKAQTWGVMETGFDPRELRVSGGKRKRGFFKPGTQGSRAFEYQEAEGNIFRGLKSYLERVEIQRNLIPEMETLRQLEGRLTADKLAEGKPIPEYVHEDIKVFLEEVGGGLKLGGPINQAVGRMYGQVMKTLIQANPALAYRNIYQPLAFYPDKLNLFDPRNRALTPEEIKHLEINGYQDRSIEAWMHTGDALFDSVPGLRYLNKFADKVKVYNWSDRTNRRITFWAKKNAVERAMSTDKPLESKLKDAKFSDMSRTQQKEALEILTTEGPDAYGNYAALRLVEDTQFMYDRSQRSIAEIYPGSGRLLSNLALFPRAYAERIVLNAQKIKNGSPAEKVRGMKVIMSQLVGGYIVGEFYSLTTVKDNPYTPGNVLSYSVGGLQLSSIVSAGEVGTDIFTAISPGVDEKERKRVLGKLVTEIPRLGDMYIPFYMLAMNGFESVETTEFIDKQSLRGIRQMLDSEYTYRKQNYDIERSILEAWQHFLFGSGVDRQIKEREAEKKRLSGRRSRSRSTERSSGR